MNFLETVAGKLILPLIGAPMFLVSGPDLVIEQCFAGIIGTMPARHVRDPILLGPAIERIASARTAFSAAYPARPLGMFGINLVVRHRDARFEVELRVCVEHRVPLVITSLGVSRAVVEQIHAYGGFVLHDVTNIRHARHAIAEGVDGIIVVCAGAGGHAGSLNPFAIVRELRREYGGPIILGGAITDGYGLLAAIALGADLAYVGTRFIATRESDAPLAYKQMLVDSAAADILYTPFVSGIPGNFLKPSFVRAGLDPANLPPRPSGSSQPGTKSWKDLWSAGQGVGNIHDIPTTAELVIRLRGEFDNARQRLARLDERRSDQRLGLG